MELEPRAKDLTPATVLGDPCRQMIAAGTALIVAQSEEVSLRSRCCKFPEDQALYAMWAQSRQRLEECQSAYIASVERADFADVPIRRVAEA
jgi:hypothetical protein